MIGYLEGELITQLQDGVILIGVGAAHTGRVGYLIRIPDRVEYLSLGQGQTIELFIYTHVREEAFDLYGFLSQDEKNFFLTLLQVSGIGPKTALGILSKLEPRAILQAILDNDSVQLSQAPGIGKKTAERIVVELSDQLTKKVSGGAFGTFFEDSTGRRFLPVGASAKDKSDLNKRDLLKDAKAALLGLGYRDSEAEGLIQKVLKDGQAPLAVEDVVRSALKQ